MHDDNERIHLSSTGQWRLDQTDFARAEKTSVESNNYSLNGKLSPNNTSSEPGSSEEETPQLMRTKSDASFVSVQRRTKLHSPGELQRMKRHRFSINGHFYNHKTSVFTPAYGSVTNVRVNSTMTTPQVLKLILNKFRVENKPEEFALYMVHETGERSRLTETEYPLIARLLYGPCERISKIFLMETDLGEEVTYDVSGRHSVLIKHHLFRIFKLKAEKRSWLLHESCKKMPVVFQMLAIGSIFLLTTFLQKELNLIVEISLKKTLFVLLISSIVRSALIFLYLRQVL
nr:PREDICTED: ras association domain-containing protein 4 isoform X3 [Lepisosteus oculatus]